MSRFPTTLCFVLSLSLFSGMAFSQTEGNPKEQCLDEAPNQGEEAIPSGKRGVDFNLTDEQGLRHGPWIRFYSDGPLYYSGWFEHGLPVGSWWYFNKQGFAEMHVVHHDNPLLSDVRVYFDSEKVFSAEGTLHSPRIGIEGIRGANLEPPKKHETWTIYAADGSVINVLNYSEGEKHGTFKIFLPDGTLTQTGSYHQGSKDGEWVSWFESGQLKERVNYDQGLLDGVSEHYWNNSRIKSKGHYIDEMKMEHFNFLENGLTEVVYMYRDGERVEEEDLYFNGTFVDWFGEDRPAYERTY